mgnify:CR=1 FL=1
MNRSFLRASFGATTSSILKAPSPSPLGTRPALYRYDVMFLRDEVSPAQVLKVVSLKEGVDAAFAGRGVVYFSRLVSKVTQSRLNRVAALPVYRQMTIRNWNTTTRLYELLSS